MFIKSLAAIVASVLIAACDRRQAPEPAPNVSLLQLIAAPRVWDGKLVRVIGFLRLEFEGDALFLHEEDLLHRISANAVGVDLAADFPERAKLNTNYVLIEGTFVATDPRDAPDFGGNIRQIRRAEIWRGAETGSKSGQP